AFVLAMLGALAGYAIQARPWLRDQAALLTLALAALLPALMAAESATEPEPAIRVVHTEVVINAPPDRVWPHVIAFPPLPERDGGLCKAGMPYPRGAEFGGRGAGAVRPWFFPPGPFVEPIDVWAPPARLRFRVSEQPEPMREWSPYAIHPAHLDHYLQSHE